MRRVEWFVLAVAFLAALSAGAVASAVLQSQWNMAGQSGYGAAHQWRGGWMRGPPHNFTVTFEEISVSGVIGDAEYGFMVVSTESGSLRVAAPRFWTVNGESVSYFRLFAEDYLNKGDRVEITVLRLTLERSDGSTVVKYVAKSLRDLTTGVEATSVLPPWPRWGPPSTPSQPNL